jgi:hypothetical protein
MLLSLRLIQRSARDVRGGWRRAETDPAAAAEA